MDHEIGRRYIRPGGQQGSQERSRRAGVTHRTFHGPATDECLGSPAPVSHFAPLVKAKGDSRSYEGKEDEQERVDEQ